MPPIWSSCSRSKSGKLWVVHRLDKITSGVMVFARTAETHRALSMQFEQHEVEKGIPCHRRRHTRMGSAHRPSPAAGGCGSQPSYGSGSQQREIIRDSLPRPGAIYRLTSLLEAIPATGRTHQIRVHAYALGFPLLGDSLYSAPATDLIARPALHAYSLTFTHPATGERVTFIAPYPEDFQTALEKLRAGR